MQLRFGQFVFSPAIVPSVVFALLMPLLVSLGEWQLTRASEKQVLVDDKRSRQEAEALVLNAAVVDPMLDRFRPASATGHYVEGQQWLLDNRLYRGQAGYHVFSLFQLKAGEQILVNRGWVAVGESRAVLPRLPLPTGELNLLGHLDSPESVGVVLEGMPLSSIDSRVLLQSLDVAELADARGLRLLPLTLVVEEGQVSGLQYDWAPVETISPEKHVGYAVQWFALAVALLIIYLGVNTRRLQKKGA